MSYRLKKVPLLSAAVLLASAISGFASDDELLVISPAPDRSACASASVRVGEQSVLSELCVIQGRFSHDRYVLKLDGEVVVQGIDDQTTSGISKDYKDHVVTLKCPPQEIGPNAAAADILKAVPSYPPTKAREVADLMVGARSPIEIGRLCGVMVGSQTPMKVQVLF